RAQRVADLLGRNDLSRLTREAHDRTATLLGHVGEAFTEIALYDRQHAVARAVADRQLHRTGAGRGQHVDRAPRAEDRPESRCHPLQQPAHRAAAMKDHRAAHRLDNLPLHPWGAASRRAGERAAPTRFSQCCPAPMIGESPVRPGSFHESPLVVVTEQMSPVALTAFMLIVPYVCSTPSASRYTCSRSSSLGGPAGAGF